MLDYFSIFTLGGSVLWNYEWNKLVGDPVNTFIEQCIIEQRNQVEKKFTYSSQSVSYTLKWAQNNGLGLVFVAVHRSVLSVPYVEELLRRVKNSFEYVYTETCHEYPSFSEKFQEILARCEGEQQDELDVEEDAVVVNKLSGMSIGKKKDKGKENNKKGTDKEARNSQKKSKIQNKGNQNKNIQG